MASSNLIAIFFYEIKKTKGSDSCVKTPQKPSLYSAAKLAWTSIDIIPLSLYNLGIILTQIFTTLLLCMYYCTNQYKYSEYKGGQHYICFIAKTITFK